jgi:hypothetical protein
MRVKHLSMVLLAAALQEGAYANGPTNDTPSYYPPSPLHGDVRRMGHGFPLADYTNFNQGVSIGQGDVEMLYTGDTGSAAQVVAAKIAQTGAQVPRSLFTPGAALGMTRIPSLQFFNAQVIQAPNVLGVQGEFVHFNINKHRSATPAVTLTKSVAGLGVGVPVNVTFAAADLPVGITRYTVPMFFVTIGASAITAISGQPISIRAAVGSDFDAAANAELWLMKRIDSTKEIRIIWIPWARVNDYVVPLLGQWGPGVTSLVVTVQSGIPVDAQLTVTCPGQDSGELSEFAKAWNLPI